MLGTRSKGRSTLRSSCSSCSKLQIAVALGFLLVLETCLCLYLVVSYRELASSSADRFALIGRDIKVATDNIHTLSRTEEYCKSVMAAVADAVKGGLDNFARNGQAGSLRPVIAPQTERPGENERDEMGEEGKKQQAGAVTSALADAEPAASALAAAQTAAVVAKASAVEAAAAAGASGGGGGGGGGGAGDKPWLVLALPSVAREVDYLSATLESIRRQLPDPRAPGAAAQLIGPDSIRVLIMDVSPPGENKAFLEQRRRFQDSAWSPYFHFAQIGDGAATPKVVDPQPGATDKGTADHPGARVRKQTRDVAMLLRHPVASSGRLFLFMEDDFRLCPSALEAIAYLVRKAGAYAGAKGWNAARVSYGLNGIVIHSQDVLTFSTYLEQHQARRPPDHLAVEWFAGEKPQSKATKAGRAHFAFKYNLFEHLGTVSSLRQENQVSWPVCYEKLVSPTLFDVEAFNERQCPGQDVWPCKGFSYLERDDGKEAAAAEVGWGDLYLNVPLANEKNWRADMPQAEQKHVGIKKIAMMPMGGVA